MKPTTKEKPLKARGNSKSKLINPVPVDQDKGKQKSKRALSNLPISWWKAVNGYNTATKPYTKINPKICSLEQAINSLRTDKDFKKHTAKYQSALAAGRDKKYLTGLKNNFVNFYFSVAKFDKSLTKANVIAHSGFLHHDIEKLTKDVYVRILEDPYLVAMGKSVSGENNYWLLMYCPSANPINHVDLWNASAKYLSDTYDLPKPSTENKNGKVDRVSDITRFRACSFDPNLFFNPNAKAFSLPQDIDAEDLLAEYVQAPAEAGNVILTRLFYKFGGLCAAGRVRGVATYNEGLTLAQKIAENREAGSDSKAIAHQYKEGYKKPLYGAHTEGISEFCEFDKDGGYSLTPAGSKWLKEHIFIMPSTTSANKLAHVFVSDLRVCSYFESTHAGKMSQVMLAHIRDIEPRWGGLFPPVIENEFFKSFNPALIEKDTEHSLVLYLKNGTIKVTAEGGKFIAGNQRGYVWQDMVTPIDYVKGSPKHELHELAKLVTLDKGKALKMGLGYSLHRYWFHTAAKVVCAVDHNPKNRGDGRRGKDLYLKLCNLFRNGAAIKWKQQSNFWTGNINPGTALMYAEDVSPYIAIDDEIKGSITGDLKIEPKGINIYTIPFEDKPKMIWTMQSMPIDYHTVSVRERIWLIEFTDYLQTRKPTKRLNTLSSSLVDFIVSCAVYYFKHIEEFKKVTELTKDQHNSAMEKAWGSNIVYAAGMCNDAIKKDGFIKSSAVVMYLDCDKNDTKTKKKLKAAYEAIYGVPLNASLKRNGSKVFRVYEHKKK